MVSELELFLVESGKLPSNDENRIVSELLNQTPINRLSGRIFEIAKRLLHKPRKAAYDIICKDGRHLFKHRIVIEAKLGRKLEPNELVHHIDGNTHNNSFENLQIVSQDQHNQLHKFGGHK